MKFSEIMESELNKNYPGDSVENILNSIGDNQTLKGQIKELKKLYYSGIKKDSIENKYKTKFNLNPDQSLNSWKDGNWDRYFKSLNNNEKIGVLKNELEQQDKRIQEKEKEILKIKEEKDKNKKLLEDLKKSPEGKEFKLKELQKILLMKNIPKVAQTIYENLKSEEFNKKLKSILSTALDMNLLKLRLDYKFIHSNIEKWVQGQKRGNSGWWEKIQNFIKNFFPIENLLGEYKQYFDIQKDWSSNSIYSLDIGNERLDSETMVKTLQIKININIEDILKEI